MAAAAPPSAPAFSHAPVMLREIVAIATAQGCRRLVDCTVGGAGHAQALLEALPHASLLALDRDASAVAAARARLARFGARAQVVHAPFSQLAEVVGQAPFAAAPDFILADFGVSSHQLDTAARGFSFRGDGPLDMRMDPERGQSAAELIAHSDAAELAELIWRLGEERYSRRIARALVANPPQTTLALADLVRANVPKVYPKPKIDPATRTFQALRMAVNDELGEIERLLALAPDLLGEGGAMVALSFHSLEDRLVKRAFAAAAHPCSCPPELPVCGCGRTATLRQPQRRAQVPAADEVAQNPRARSTKLRWAVRLGRTPP